MTVEYINIFFHNSIEDLENEFLGIAIQPNGKNNWIQIERVFYEIDGITGGTFELTRISDKNGLLNFDIDYTYTSINYNEFSFDLWKNYLIGYKEQFLIPVQLKDFFNKIDDFFYNTKDIETKKLLFSSIKNTIVFCIGELQEVQNKENLSNYKEVLLDLYLDVYKSYLGSLNSEKYLGYNSNSVSVPKIDKIEIDTTNFYKKLQEINFLEVLQSKYPKNFIKITSTLGRSQECGGIIIDIKTTYFVFCNEVGLINFLENLKFDSLQIGKYLQELSGFNSDDTVNDFRRNHEYKIKQKHPKHNPFSERNLEKVEDILLKLEEK